jgi:SAM-dependent methyltransferase
MEPPRLADEILAHYRDGRPEDTRLRAGAGLVELRRTQDVLRRWIAPGSGRRILDVGGASGVHATWLAADGHHVEVVDPVPLHVEQAAAAGAAASPAFTASLGDARALAFGDESADVVLLLGPLYHLVDAADRARAWAEATRVVREGGVVAAAGISRFASLHDGLARGYLADAGFRAIVEEDLRSGQHRNQTEDQHWFTTAYFHHPYELAGEAEAAGLAVEALVGVEGLSAWLLRSDVDDPLTLDQHVAAAEAVEAEPTLLGLSPHLLVVCRR